jgi:hypothetical protein
MKENMESEVWNVKLEREEWCFIEVDHEQHIILYGTFSKRSHWQSKSQGYAGVCGDWIQEPWVRQTDHVLK